jgi:Family of unknown function (DUF6308)
LPPVLNALELPSGCVIERPHERVLAFCDGEFAYYDAIPTGDANRIEPLDVLVTVAMNSRVDTAKKVRQVHQGMTLRCEPLLPSIRADADLLDFERWRDPMRELLHAAVQAPGVLIATATKVLHRKRRFLIPMLDFVVLRYYLAARPAALRACIESKSGAADGAMEAVVAFHDDLLFVRDEIDSIRESLRGQGYSLSPVRILEVLVWTQTEPAGGYRT